MILERVEFCFNQRPFALEALNVGNGLKERTEEVGIGVNEIIIIVFRHFHGGFFGTGKREKKGRKRERKCVVLGYRERGSEGSEDE